MTQRGDSASDALCWPHYLAILTSGTTVILILVGGLVTSMGAGLAVPDWPTSFGYHMFLFPWARMVGGIFYEHSHRLLGSLVGILTILTAATLWLREPRKWVRWLGIAAIFLVIVQGLLGGFRVIFLKLHLAIIHACVAQLYFGLMVSLAVFTSKSWLTNIPAPSESDAGTQKIALFTVGLIYIQTVFGAILRHTGNLLDAHLLMAFLVAIHVFLLASKVLREPNIGETIRKPANAIWVLLVLQLALGIGSYLGKYPVIGDTISPSMIIALTSAHVLVGALLFATSIMLALRIHGGWLRTRFGTMPQEASAT